MGPESRMCNRDASSYWEDSGVFVKGYVNAIHFILTTTPQTMHEPDVTEGKSEAWEVQSHT